jgi:hypothetical protein
MGIDYEVRPGSADFIGYLCVHAAKQRNASSLDTVHQSQQGI